MTTTTLQPPAGRPIRVGLWVAQVLLAVAFCGIGLMKLTMPIPELAATMKWPGEYSPGFVRFVGVIDLLGGLGVLLPSLTRVMPRLSVLAAQGCVMLQAVAIAFHLSRGEVNALPLNAVLISLAAFVLWGRSRKLPIAPRG